jgi:hypothetical protein
MRKRAEPPHPNDRTVSGPSVAVIYAAGDTAIAQRLMTFLSDAGMAVGSGDHSTETDGAVVLISAASLRDTGWQAAAGTIAAGRVVPLSIGRVDTARVPEKIRNLNRIDLNTERPLAGFGSVLAGLLVDPTRLQAFRHLAHEADVWSRGGKRLDLLIDDDRRARQMQALLAELSADPLAVPTPLMIEFVSRSGTRAKRRSRRRRRRQVFAAASTFGALAAVAVVLPQIVAKTRNNHSAIVTTGDPAILAQLPEWSAANAGALLLNGTTAEQTLAEGTLLQALSQRWPISNVDFVANIVAMTPFAGGSRAAMVGASTSGGTAFAVLDVRASRVLWSVPLPAAGRTVDVSSDGQLAVVAGDGVTAVDLASHAARRVLSRGQFGAIRLFGRGRAVLATTAARLEVANLASGSATTVGSYPSVMDLESTPGGSVEALVSSGHDRFEIVNGRDGSVLASGTIRPSATVWGALAPEGGKAIVSGADGQLWQLDANDTVTPTGIPLPVDMTDVSWASDDRVVVASDDLGGEVFYLPRAEFLGTVCGDVIGLSAVRAQPNDNTISCLGRLSSFWGLPAAPLAKPPSAYESTSTTVTDLTAIVRTQGRNVQIFWRGRLGSGSTTSFSPFNAAVSAVMLSPDGDHLVLGSQAGEVAVLDLSFEHARIVTAWVVPDAAPIAAVGWHNGPVVTTRSGQSWLAPDCSLCGSDSGLLQELRDRASGCLTALQMEWIDVRTRRALGLRLCPAPPSELPGV